MFVSVFVIGSFLLIEIVAGLDDIPIFVMITALILLALGVSLVLGAAIGSVLCPVVPVKRDYSLSCVLLGMAIAVVTGLLSVFILIISLELDLLLATGVAACLSGPVLRVIGLSTGWARPWYAPGMCQSCGYDLRETPPGGSCPECGEVAEKPFVSHT